MNVRLPSKAEFDALQSALEALAREWAERECSSFDEAVRKAAGEDPDEGSIWDMPAIDSKRCVSLLVELESLFKDCKIPVSVIKAGGYTSVDDLISKLLSKIRERCPDGAKPGLASTGPVTSTASPAQVVP
jgi:hypothetical protein